MTNSADARPGPFSPAEVAFLVGVPLLWGILLLFHPVGDEFYAAVADNLTRWLAVHLGSVLFIPLMAGVMFLLLRGVEGTAALVGRIALAVFAVVYLVFEAVVGIGTGLMVDNIDGLPAAERADLVDDYIESSIVQVLEAVGSAGWIVAALAAAAALSRRADGSRSVAIVLLLVLSAVPITFHVTPFGPVGLAMFIGAILLVVRDRSAARAPRPLAQPRVA
jgi:signal transduction histidine kinase